MERLGYEDMEKLKDEGKEEELRNWASFRGQTLSRTGNQILTTGYWWRTFSSHFYAISYLVTVRGMMYYREALKLQAFLDMAEDEGEEHLF